MQTHPDKAVMSQMWPNASATHYVNGIEEVLRSFLLFNWIKMEQKESAANMNRKGKKIL